MLEPIGIGFKIPIKPLIIQILIALLFAYLTMPPVVNSANQYIGNASLLPDNFIPTIEEWERVGADYQIDSNDSDTSYIRFQWEHTDEVKTLSYFTFQNLSLEPKGSMYSSNITSILNVTVYYRYRVEVGGEWFRFSGYWFNGSTWITDEGFATSVAEWHTSSKDLTEILDTPEKVQNVRVYFRNAGAPSWDDEGRITYAYLDVWFTYEEYLIDFIGIYFGLGLFIGGVIMMIFAPSWVAWKIKKSGVTPDTVERFGYAMLLFLIGFGLFINYIYGV